MTPSELRQRAIKMLVRQYNQSANFAHFEKVGSIVTPEVQEAWDDMSTISKLLELFGAQVEAKKHSFNYEVLELVE